MAEKNADKLAELFHESAQFVHMGGYWGKEQELNTDSFWGHLVQESRDT